MATQWKLGRLAVGFSLALAASTACAHVDSQPSELGEVEAPDSVLNKDRGAPAPVGPERYSAQLGAAESGNPDSVGSTLAASHPAIKDEQFRADEAGNPNSVDSRLLPTRAMLERLHAYDAGKIAVAQLARQNGGEASAAFASKLVRERESAEQQIAALASKLFISLEQPGDRPARNQLVADRATLARLQQAKGSEFDRSFARQMQQTIDLEAVRAMRTKCVEPDVCSLLDQLIPVLQSEQAEAVSLGVAVCGAESC